MPYDHVCLQYDEGGTGCGFTSYSQCLATASGMGAECYGAPARGDADDPRAFGAWKAYPAGLS